MSEHIDFDASTKQDRLLESFWELPLDVQDALNEEGESIGLQIWRLRKNGCNQYLIAKKLGLSISLVEKSLRRFESLVGMEAGGMMQHYRLLDIERIEDLIGRWFPQAVPGGEISTGDDFDHGLKAAYLVLTAIKDQLRILQVGQPGAGKNGQAQDLLQQVLPGVSKVLQEVEKAEARNLG
jgi:hypothetical protein